METLNNIKCMDISQFDWATYYKDGKERLKHQIETNPEMWDIFTKFHERYVLVTNMCLLENDFSKSTGTVTASFNIHVGSDSIENLINVWSNFFSKRPYNTTKQHFIVDTKDKKVVEFVSVCM